MSEKPITKEELYATHIAGGRHNGEESRALPKRYYGDPADSFEYPSERARREEAKRVARAKGRMTK